MTWLFTDEQEAFRDMVRDFADREIAPHAARRDRDRVFPSETVTAMGDLGLFGLVFPEKYGGAGADFIIVSRFRHQGKLLTSLICLQLGAHRSWRPSFVYSPAPESSSGPRS